MVAEIVVHGVVDDFSDRGDDHAREKVLMQQLQQPKTKQNKTKPQK